jgi:hypothetical protein
MEPEAIMTLIDCFFVGLLAAIALSIVAIIFQAARIVSRMNRAETAFMKSPWYLNQKARAEENAKKLPCKGIH